jgi:hypothetical protein
VTLVTISDYEIRAYHHVGKTGVCIAVSAVLQNSARILNAGMALEEYELEQEPPRLVIRAAIGDYLAPEEPMSEQIRVARQRTGRYAFVKAVFDGVKTTLEEIARLNGGGLLEIKDTREMREDKPSQKALCSSN